MTECNTERYTFEGPGRREVVAKFDADYITSEAGSVLLSKVEERTKILERFAACFEDRRDPDRIEHTVSELVTQRIIAIALGYEDLNDHDALRVDTLLASMAGKVDPTGQDRERERDRGKPLAGKSTLNRLELSACGGDSRYKKILPDARAIEQFFLDSFFEAHEKPLERMIIDLDPTNDSIHGGQEGRFFHGYYDEYCFLPLYAFCGDHLLFADLRTADCKPADGLPQRLDRLVDAIRERWPGVEIVFRADADFSTDELMSWCEERGLHYVFGLAKNNRLEEEIRDELAEARARAKQTKKACRVFKEFHYRTQRSWSCERRVVAKAEHLPGGKDNPRFVVTSWPQEVVDAELLYSFVYCARGEMENRIKEQQLCLYADRTSCHQFRANQLRLWLYSAAYVLMEAFRRLGLEGTELERAYCSTIRAKLFKIGALIQVTVRKVWVRMAAACPYKDLFAAAYHKLACG